MTMAPETQAPIEDIFYRQARQVRSHEDSFGNTVRSVPLNKDKTIWLTEVHLADTRKGINKATWGHLEVHIGQAAESTLETRFANTLCLCGLTTNATTPDPTVSGFNLVHANAFQRLLMGIGSATGAAGFSETSGTDPTVIVESGADYNPNGTGDIVGMWHGLLNSVSSVIIGISGSAADVITSAAFAVAGQMHADTANMSGAIQTKLPNQPWLFSNGAVLQSLDANVAITTEPTDVNTTWVSGTYDIGLLGPGGGYVRAWWVQPQTASFKDGNIANNVPAQIVHTDQFGFDSQKFPTPLKNILGAVEIPARQAWIAHDSDTFYYFAGSSWWHGNPFKDRQADSDRVYKILDFYRKGSDVFMEVERRAAASGTGNTERRIEFINLDDQAIHAVTPWTTLSSTGRMGLVGPRGLPVSDFTGFAHIYSDGSWRRTWLPDLDQNPFTMARQTSGAQTGSGQQFETSGVWTSTPMNLPGPAGGYPTVLAEIISHADIPAGGGDSSIAYAVATQSTTGPSFTNALTRSFYARDRVEKNVAKFPMNRDAFTLFQPRITITQRTDGSAPTRYTPNALPVTYRLLTFTDGQVRSPVEVLGSQWARS